MQDLSNMAWLQGWIKSALAYVGGAGLLGFLFRDPLKRALERVIDSRFDERLARIKHELDLEQQKMSVVYQNQKDSFRNVLVAMHNAMEAIENEIAGEGDWRPISQEPVEALSREMAQASLFLDAASDRALRLFREVMWEAVQYEDQIPSGGKVWRAHDQMKFIADRLAQHFRMRVGLVGGKDDPLLDIDILGACRDINRYSFPDHKLPTRGPLKSDESRNSEELVATARRNPTILKEELGKLKAATQNERFFFETAAQADLYLERVKTL
jgi:hypothetical protein